MNFGNLQLHKLFHLTPDDFIACSGTSYKQLLQLGTQSMSNFSSIINTFGSLSAKSQSLKQPITTFIKFSGSDQRIYIKISPEENKVLGFIKVGQKNLFYRDYIGSIKQLRPTCVLDIYVHESCQRTGVGKEIFQKFLEIQKIKPEKLAYDRPSPKLVSFLKKHYELTKHIQQNNNFLIFDQYFLIQDQKKNGSKRIGENYLQGFDSELKKISNKNINSNGYSTRNLTEEKVIDSLQMLEKQVENMKNKNNLNSRQKKMHDLRYRTPWAIKNQPYNFRVTSNTYGNHLMR